MRRSFVAPWLVACALPAWFSFGCSSTESPPSGTGASPGSGGAGNAASSGGSAGSSANGGAAASGGTNSTGGSGVSGTTATGGASGTGNAGSSSGGSGSGSGTGGAAGTIDDGCALLPQGPVTFSVPSGTFQGTVSIELTTAEAGAEIRYTTDHTPPTASSALYAGALALTQTTELRVQAFLQGAPLGGPQTAVYVARAVDAAHDLPVMILDSYGVEVPGQNSGGTGQGLPAGAPPPSEYVDAAVMTFEPAGAANAFASAPTTATPAGFHVRGQSSASYDKKPYRVELRDASNADRNCVLLGMPAESDWVLHSPFPDKALIRNAFVYSLGPELGMPAPRGKFVEVYLNTAARPLEGGDYQGVYLLVETIKNQKNRLNLQQLEPADTTLPALSGGYIFKFEWRVGEIEQMLTCPTGDHCWNYLEVADPKPWVQEQHDYLAGYLRQLVDALHSAAPADPATGYPAFVDTASFVNQVIVHELTRNLDAYTRSQFFHKDRDGKVVTGPLWDYDLIAGVGTRGNSENMAIEGFQYESSAMRFSETADWFPLLLAEPTFRAALVTRWQELRQGVLSDAQISARIDGLAAGLAAGAARNFAKWPILATERIGFFDTPVTETWEGQVTAMRDWLIGRAAWLDAQWI